VDLATSKATTASAAADAASASSAGDDAGAAAPGGASAALSAPSAAAPDAGAAAGSAPASAAGDAAPTRSDQPPSTAPTVTTLRAQGPVPTLESHASTPKSAVEARKPSAAAEEAASSSQRAWAVQLGSFANKENAEKLAHQLRAQRAPVYVISSGSGPSLRYRVRVGPLRDREAAEHAIAKLKSEGHPATLVAP
jgi:DedD protein